VYRYIVSLGGEGASRAVVERVLAGIVPVYTYPDRQTDNNL
jgi:hypothetical protein